MLQVHVNGVLKWALIMDVGKWCVIVVLKWAGIIRDSLVYCTTFIMMVWHNVMRHGTEHHQIIAVFNVCEFESNKILVGSHISNGKDKVSPYCIMTPLSAPISCNTLSVKRCVTPFGLCCPVPHYQCLWAGTGFR